MLCGAAEETGDISLRVSFEQSLYRAIPITFPSANEKYGFCCLAMRVAEKNTVQIDRTRDGSMRGLISFSREPQFRMCRCDGGRRARGVFEGA
jgi:hypothetical protein